MNSIKKMTLDYVKSAVRFLAWQAMELCDDGDTMIICGEAEESIRKGETVYIGPDGRVRSLRE